MRRHVIVGIFGPGDLLQVPTAATEVITRLDLVASQRRLDHGVVFQKWRWPFLHCPSKGIAVDKQANDDVVHLGRFRKADGLADQTFNARP